MRYAKSALKKRPAKGKRVYRKRVAKPSKAFAKKVQAIISKNAETKASYHSLNSTGYNSGINSSSDIEFCCPNVAQGIHENERIGDQVRAQSLIVKGIITQNLTSTYNSACRLGVRVMIVQPKLYTDRDEIRNNAAVWLGSLLKRGGVTSGYTGTTQDFGSEINTDLITTYYDKKFYISIPTAVTAAGAMETKWTTKFWSASLKIRGKILKYTQAYQSGLSPTNYSPCLILGYTHLDGSSPDVVNTQVFMSYDAYLKYEDA